VCVRCFGLYLGHQQACQYKNFIKEDIVKSKGQSIQCTNLLILLINVLQKLYYGLKIATELREENFKKYHAAPSIIHKNHRTIVILILTRTHEELNLIKVFIRAF
jgi:hypothetical protein